MHPLFGFNICVWPAAGNVLLFLQFRSLGLLMILQTTDLSLSYNPLIYVSRKFSSIIFKDSKIFVKLSAWFQLISFLDEVYHTCDLNVPSAAVYFDFSKVFDSVRHDIILNKLSVSDFVYDFLLLFLSYLCNRSQCVRINAHFSNACPVSSGVLQCRILGRSF